MSTWNQNAPAPLVTFVSASGGVGKSALALVSGWLAARAGIDTVLLEADLQFGDMAFWLGLDDELPDLGLGVDAAPVMLRDGLSLYKAPCLPEVAEEVSESVAELVSRVRRGGQLVIADTGQFWSGLTADLVCGSDFVLIVNDQRASSIVGAVKARELLGRIGIPASRCACVYNRWGAHARLNEKDVSRGTGVELVLRVPDGKGEVEMLLSSGNIEELVESGNAFVRGIDQALRELMPRMGKTYAEVADSRKARRFK